MLIGTVLVLAGTYWWLSLTVDLPLHAWLRKCYNSTFHEMGVGVELTWGPYGLLAFAFFGCMALYYAFNPKACEDDRK